MLSYVGYIPGIYHHYKLSAVSRCWQRPEWSCAHSARPRCHRTKRHRFGLYPASRKGPSGLGDVKPKCNWHETQARRRRRPREMIRGRPKLLLQHDILSIWYYRYHMVSYAISVYRESMIDIAQSTCRLLAGRPRAGSSGPASAVPNFIRVWIADLMVL